MRLSFPLLPGSLLLLAAHAAPAQTGELTDSFDDDYAAPSGIRYRYDEALGQHDYSGNWDFDQDGTPDGLFFVDANGPHRDYFLRVALSSDRGVTRDFPLLVTGLPVLPPDYRPAAPPVAGAPGFTVFADAAQGGRLAVLLCLDRPTYALTRGLLEGQGLRTGCVAVSFAGGGTVLRDYAPPAAN